MPPRFRRRLMSIYAFARLVDDIGDEAPGDRNACWTRSNATSTGSTPATSRPTSCGRT
ncbi:hypothetical protein [Kutzneria kofuensis]|uniref:hypothetical protein n=1 Tax=Kutzneria kofuensis TaxID=103725 RepID=UPI0031E50B29